MLRRTLWRRGLRYRIAGRSLPGRPDLVFATAKVLVFVDGDFWHGRNFKERARRLSRGHNAFYWIAKVKANIERDQRHNAVLRGQGWKVLRFWESEVFGELGRVAEEVVRLVIEGGV